MFVAAHHAAQAIEDAIEAEIPLVVAVAEHVPVHDMMRIHSMLQTQSKTRLVGANAPGIINPGEHCLVGFLPHPTFLPGTIGIVGKSGTLSYEAVASTTRVGLGQSLVVGMGGDWLAGTTLTDAVRVFLEDDKTEGIIVIGEIGGAVELEVAEVLKEWKGKKKPVMGLVGGLMEKEGEVMGHAGAVRMFGDVDARTKIKALEDAGVVMVTHPGQFGEGMCKLLGRRPPLIYAQGMGPEGPRRRFHTAARPRAPPPPVPGVQRRGLKLKADKAAEFIKQVHLLHPGFCGHKLTIDDRTHQKSSSPPTPSPPHPPPSLSHSPSTAQPANPPSSSPPTPTVHTPPSPSPTLTATTPQAPPSVSAKMSLNTSTLKPTPPPSSTSFCPPGVSLKTQKPT